MMRSRPQGKQGNGSPSLLSDLQLSERKKISKHSKRSHHFIHIRNTRERLKKSKIESDCSDSNDSSSLIQEPLKEMSLRNILNVIDELSSEPDTETKAIVKCSSQMSLNSEIFWTSPTAILRAIKYSILRRNWDDVTHLLLLLLQHKDQYIPIVQSILPQKMLQGAGRPCSGKTHVLPQH
ncbi:hypothetical protein HHI36_003374 [Cryptolaemus montrouzieri]|uniref:Uncharacterized protein n=1 Tax=Cryptolaemus montrouzieri TaxID=559131 RepID=A0ABD2PDF7_9CUCU